MPSNNNCEFKAKFKVGFIITDINIPNAFGKNKYVRKKLSFDLCFYIS